MSATWADLSVADIGDTDLRTALEDLSVPALLAVCAELLDVAGREELLAGDLRPVGCMLNEIQGFMAPEDQAAARDRVFEILCDWRARGCPDPEPIDQATAHRVMQFATGAEIAPEYVPMLLEELALDGQDQRAATPVDGAENYPVVIIGCGMSGILTAVRLMQAGFPVQIIEKNPGPGGTWLENTYPGARVDVGSHFYSYSFEPTDQWTEYFSRQPELLAYFERVVSERGIREHVRFDTEVTGATWSEEAGAWTVHLDDGTDVTASAVVAAVGQLNRPHIPDLPGTFDGPSFHTSRWDHEVDVTGKDVVMVGAGATGFQVAPAIADDVKSLTVIQRTAQWMFPNPGYHNPVPEAETWAMRNLPHYDRWFRFLVLWGGCDGGLAAAEVDPNWEPQQQSVSEINDFARQMFTEWIVSQVPDRPDLIEKVVPDYPATGKRTLQDNGSWLKALTRDNVELVRAGVERLEADGILDSQGRRHRADVLVWATGFKPNDFLLPMSIVGRDGQDLREMWNGKPQAHLGVDVPGFPNFFMMYGPGTNLASGGSIILASECEVAYVVACLSRLAREGGRSIEVKREAFEAYNDRLQAEMSTKVWASPHIAHNYYVSDQGDVVSLNPFRIVDYWAWTRDPDPADLDVR
ncbi:flavin-containing monooxygenase [Nocardioides sp.]|uniref:flavin-containing monooxygenase n=1 Tax=Nocardioides sp. TaxID=35761 RepID=UPI00356842DF